MKVSKHRQWGIQAYWLFAIIYWEILAHAGMYGQFHSSFLFALGFSAAGALVLGTLISLLPKKAVVPVSAVVSAVLVVLYGSQMVYCFIFGTPYSVSQIGLGADAMTNFWREMLQSMLDHLLWLLGLFVPFLLLLVLRWRKALEKPGLGARLRALVLAPVLALAVWGAICLGGTDMYSNHYFFTNSGSTTSQTMERFGVPATFLLEYVRPENDTLLLGEDLLLSMDLISEITEPVRETDVTETTAPAAETKAAEATVSAMETEVTETTESIPETEVTEATLSAMETEVTETTEPIPETEGTEATLSAMETEVTETTEPIPETEGTEATLSAMETEVTETTEPIPETEGTEATEEPTEEATQAPAAEEERAPAYNAMDIDFEALAQETGSTRLATLHRCFAQLPPTKQNEYTGKFRDYNLIVICAESFSPAALDPEVTPTLYQLAHEGFVFNNYFNSFPNTTTNGEYALTQGLYPDSTRDKYNSSMRASYKNTLPFTLGNAFAQQLGITSRGYHNYLGDYYSRYLTHPNMGYEMKFNHSGMELSNSWPNSDLEMMEASVDDYIHDPQFNVYYMTFSGHYQYKPDVNAMVAKNYDLVKDIPGYGVIQKGYLACNIELDRAMEYLLRRLEEEGIADKTVIVMASDHYPYGIPEDDYFQMLGQPKDWFEKYRSTLIFWVGGMEPVEVNEYCCNVDILPTLLNMWGLEYDSRLLSGTDIFSDSLHMAVLIDRSFLTDTVWFNSNRGEIRYQVDESLVPEGYVASINKLISTRFDLAKEIVRNDYYSILFPKE